MILDIQPRRFIIFSIPPFFELIVQQSIVIITQSSSFVNQQTVKYILEGGKSASKVAVELGIDKNTICRWVREYREAHQMPTYEVERKIKKQSADELIARNKELEMHLSVQ